MNKELVERFNDEIEQLKISLDNTKEYMNDGMINPEYTKIKGQIMALEWAKEISKNY